MASARATIRITKEVQEIQKGTDLSLSVYTDDSNVRRVQAMIIGPPETPYEYGFFDFAVHFPADYPTNPPKVLCRTTNGGQTRFNPNIYATGKVCLSILGTWRGEAGENWSAAQCLESVLVSIQSLMSSNPYENEPGFEDATSEPHQRSSKLYVAKIKHETIRLAVIRRLEEYLGLPTEDKIEAPPAPWDSEDGNKDGQNGLELEDDGINIRPFIDICKRRFLWYFSSYLNTIDVEKKDHKDGQPFYSMPFECHGNEMKGTFKYGNLRERLFSIKRALAEEQSRWVIEGQRMMKEGRGIAVNLERQFAQIVAFNTNKIFNLTMTLAESNPFVWHLTMYGRPMTRLEGGIFNIILHISPKFPQEQPRAVLNPPIFHHRVAEDGFLCYLVKKPDEMKSHINAIIEALEDDSTPYDPRTIVRPEATKLRWGSAQEKKLYNRKLRSSVEATAETDSQGCVDMSG